MADVLTFLRQRDPAAGAPPAADPSAIRARAMQSPRGEQAATRLLPSNRLALVVALAVLAVGGTAVADRLLTASDVFSSPDAAGQGDLRAPVHPIAGSERVVQTLLVPGVGRVQLWAADGDSRSGTCLGIRFPDGSWGAVNGRSGGNGPSCFTERDDPMFKTILVPTGIDSMETNTEAPNFQRIVYGVINYDIPATAVTLVDRVTGTSVPVVDGRWFAFVDPRADPQRLDRQLVAYDASGRVVIGERPVGDPNPTALGPGG